jgi:DNA invertase Pin-like site-specific DNA recombinase
MAGIRLPKHGPRQGDKRKLPDEERERFNKRVKELREEGIPALVIASTLGVSPSTLYQRIRKPRCS